MKAIFISVFIKKRQCAKTVDPKTGLSIDPQTCDDAAALAQKGLRAKKPAGISDDDWKKLTGGTYPTVSLGHRFGRHCLQGRTTRAGISEYRTELMLYPADQTTSGPSRNAATGRGLCQQEPDARRQGCRGQGESGTDPRPSRAEGRHGRKECGWKRLVQAVWFYARAWNFAPREPQDSDREQDGVLLQEVSRHDWTGWMPSRPRRQRRSFRREPYRSRPLQHRPRSSTS